MTLDLDKKWKSLMPTLKSSGAIYTKKDDPNDEGPDTDPYNVLMRELAFEVKKGKAQERLKTDEEVIAEEKERLEKLEDERIKRFPTLKSPYQKRLFKLLKIARFGGIQGGLTNALTLISYA